MKFFGSLLVFIFSQTTFAVADPTFTSLAESLPVTQYIYDNMLTIIESSADLAKKSVPNSHYFLITKKISIFPPTVFSKDINEGTSPIATLYMESAMLNCERDIFTKIQYEDYGGKIAQQFLLKDEIRCTSK
jgi:hypothetical protein